MQELVVVSGPGTGNRFELDPDSWNTEEFLIGRSKSCHVILHDTKVSKQHARIVVRDGEWIVEDLGSRNGIHVNGERYESHPLETGTELRIGKTVMRFIADDVEPTPAPRAEPVSTESVDDAATAEITAADVPTPTAAPAPRPKAKKKPASRPVKAVRPAAVAGRFRTTGEVDLEEIKRLVGTVRDARERICDELGKVVVGQADVVEDILIGLLARGHCLLEGVPGLAKTLLVSTLAAVLDVEFRRIQFTPDLMPADITGTEVLEEDPASRERTYRFIKGPIFANVLLADEINRTPPKTQAALLEAMQEFRVTCAGTTYGLTPPFYVLATQNPIEQEGTYPLPEAQLDRFMLKIVVGYPSRDEEVDILRATIFDRDLEPEVVVGADDILELQKLVRQLPVSDYMLYYAADLARATRPDEPEAPDFVRRFVSWGAGPRAAQYLTLGAKARALLDGRANVTAEDVRSVAHQVLRHRIGLNFQAASEGMNSDAVIEQLLDHLPAPKTAERGGGKRA